MTRTVVITDTVLRTLVEKAQEQLLLHGTNVERQALADAQMALDTMLPDVELLDWAALGRVVHRFAEADRCLTADVEAGVELLVAMFRDSIEALHADPRHGQVMVGAIGSALVLSEYSAMQCHHGAIDHPTHSAMARLLNSGVLALCRFAPEELRS